MRFPTRSLATLLMMAGVATCSDMPIAAVKTGTGPNSGAFGHLALVPVFSKSAQYAASHASDFPGLRFDEVHLVMRRRPSGDIVRDTVITYTSETTNDLSLTLDVDMNRDGRQFDAVLEYRRADGQVMYSGTQQVQAYAQNETPAAPRELVIAYVGPGARVKSISVSPKTLSLTGSQSATLTVTAVVRATIRSAYHF